MKNITFKDNNALCPFCGYSEQFQLQYAKTLIGTDGYVLACKKCNSAFRYPKLDEKVVNKFYSDADFFGKLPNKSVISDRRKIARRRVRFISETIQQNTTFKTTNILLIDIGAGMGIGLEAAKNIGFQIAGIEPRQEPISWAKGELGIDIEKGLANKQSISKLLNKYINVETVVFHLSHVLEHIIEPEIFLKDILDGSNNVNNVLLFIEVPNVKYELGFKNGKSLRNLWEQHMSSFSAEGLQNLAKRLNCKSMKVIETVNPLYALYLFLLRFIHKKLGGARFFIYMNKTILILSQLYNRLLLTDNGQLMFLSIKKHEHK